MQAQIKNVYSCLAITPLFRLKLLTKTAEAITAKLIKDHKIILR